MSALKFQKKYHTGDPAVWGVAGDRRKKQTREREEIRDDDDDDDDEREVNDRIKRRTEKEMA